MNTLIERFKTAINGHLATCRDRLKYIKEDINCIKDEDDAINIFRQYTKEAYKLIWKQKYYKDILAFLENVEDVEEVNHEISIIEKRLLSQSPMKSSTSQINNLFSLYEFECLQEIYHVLSITYQSIKKNKK